MNLGKQELHATRNVRDSNLLGKGLGLLEAAENNAWIAYDEAVMKEWERHEREKRCVQR
jgi:hypothetical protein